MCFGQSKISILNYNTAVFIALFSTMFNYLYRQSSLFYYVAFLHDLYSKKTKQFKMFVVQIKHKERKTHYNVSKFKDVFAEICPISEKCCI